MLVGLLTLVILNACSSTRPYSNILSKNVTASLTKDSDAGVEAQVDVYALNKKCNSTYQGTVWFGKNPKKVGIKKNQQTLLSFKYLRSDWLTGKSMIMDDILIKARLGYRYEVKMSYVDKAYETSIYEINRRTGKRKPINIRGIHGCVEG